MAPFDLALSVVFNFSETAERNSMKLTRKQVRIVFYNVYVFFADRKTKVATLALDWLKHFRLLCNS